MSFPSDGNVPQQPTQTPSPAKKSAFVSERLETACLKLLSGMAVVFAMTAMLATAIFPEIHHWVSELLSWELVAYGKLDQSWYGPVYRFVNWLEGCLWFVFAGLVALRAIGQKRHAIEPMYAIAFLLFGLSDFLEAAMYPLWLLAWKAFNLCVLLYCRSVVMRCCYPESKLY